MTENDRTIPRPTGPEDMKGDLPGENTIISFLYRDSANYKTSNTVCINGVITQEQIDRILACLDEGEYFIPERVGLEAERWNEYDPQLDHPWCELGPADFEVRRFPYHVDITPEELVRRFEALRGCWTDQSKDFEWTVPLPDVLCGD